MLGAVAVLFFVTNDCPVSNAFAPEIARICAEYQPKGAACKLVYVDPGLSDAAAREHAATYRHGDYPRVVDRHHELVKAAGATVTPEAVVMDSSGKILYRGRIDNSIVTLGQSRRPATERDLRDALDATLAGKPVARPRTKALGCYIPE